MNVSATLDGESVTIVGIVGDGGTVSVSYINSTSELRIKKFGWVMGGSNLADKSLFIASGASV